MVPISSARWMFYLFCGLLYWRTFHNIMFCDYVCRLWICFCIDWELQFFLMWWYYYRWTIAVTVLSHGEIQTHTQALTWVNLHAWMNTNMQLCNQVVCTSAHIHSQVTSGHGQVLFRHDSTDLMSHTILCFIVNRRLINWRVDGTWWHFLHGCSTFFVLFFFVN